MTTKTPFQFARAWSSILAAAACLFLLTTVVAAQKPGTHSRSLKSGKQERDYLLHIPRGYEKAAKKKLPLVLMLHGRGGNAKIAASRYYGWKQLAEKENFIVAFPSALGTPTQWQGSWRGPHSADAKFLATLIDTLHKELRIDKNRTYMTGHSSGGFMSYSFGVTHSDKVAAIAPVAGLLLGKKAPAAPISVISIHGMADQVVAYDNVHGKKATYKGMPSAIESASFFAKHNGCEKPERRALNKGKVQVDTWKKGKSGTAVVLYSIEKGGHGWPKSGSRNLAATKTIWKFFEDNPRQSKQKAQDAKPRTGTKKEKVGAQ